MRVEIFHTNVDSYQVTEYDDASIQVSKLDTRQAISFKDIQEFHEFVAQMLQSYPKQEVDLTDKYLGTPWRYDV